MLVPENRAMSRESGRVSWMWVKHSGNYLGIVMFLLYDARLQHVFLAL